MKHLTLDARRTFTVSILALLTACGGTGSPDTHAGSGGTDGSGGATSGSSGTTSGAGGGTSGNGSGSNGGSGNSNSGNTSSGGGAGSSGDGGGIAEGGGGADDGGIADSGGIVDSGTRPDGGSSSKVLIYGVTTGFRHTSIPAAANAIATAAATHGLTAELVGCTGAANTPDPTKFTAQALAGYGAVILLANSGEPFGYPATTEIQNLVTYVSNGGALVAIEDADHCYDGQFNGHPASQPYVNLIGNDFVGHPGNVAPATCTTVGTSPSVLQLPATFGTTDEIYQTTTFRPDNQVVLTCTSSGASSPTVRPISYIREEGAGRVFYTALGHTDAVWTGPMDAKAANTRLVEDHVIPSLLWTMRR